MVAEIEPFGEDRADLRAAFNTRELMVAFAGEQSEDWQVAVIKHLFGYLKIHETPEQHIGPKIQRQLLGE